MTLVNNTSATQSPLAETKGTSFTTKQLSKDDFMTIFLKQLSIQDPMKPFDSSAMLEQMSQLSALTASENLELTISHLDSSISKSQAVSATQLVNRSVQVVGNYSPLTEEGLKGSVMLPDSATNVVITIEDNAGKIVKKIDKGSSLKGLVDFEWDGLLADGKTKASLDNYKISATATIQGKTHDLYTAGTFKVKSVSMNSADGSLFLNVDGLGGITMDDIIKIL